jgi:RNA polymerase sigma factor (sigma-70 family)
MTAEFRVSSQRASTCDASRSHGMRTSSDEDGLTIFLRARPRLFGIAYRMLRSAAEAEDVVQDVWVRWQNVDRRTIRNAAGFLATTATRLAINVMRSARARHETLIGPELPDPIDMSEGPGQAAERNQAIAGGVRLLLERLTPTERAAYILREAFGYAYRDIGNVLELAEANTRQIVTRARQHLATGRTTATSAIEHKHFLSAFMAAAQNGDVAGLEGFFISNRVSSRGAWSAHDLDDAAA